ncbi:TRAP transporter substrate-binding protein DctP [Novosphingobium flavum]|uniref:TRAP transporter substrate-binding protein DctP n=1 Tax=Novosphingobium aerophilum TaxID=2839843 RepID=A0A7X1F718_9SPHN|nr:TRAP transporter substrate-binding protein DctP [Novosphingobium aerophilum]MBC2651572.1 TRAP transporter substrate-binding protein DctP [Novosphingobium aerophilum]MBC2661515.1 TRAP transporter substrate-binding protein DctP [Novosphingobium aerophilum]
MSPLRTLLVLALGAALAACGRPADPGVTTLTTTLTYASPYPPTHPFSKADITWMKHVEQASGGRIRIKPYWSGALLSSDMSMIEIRHGLADIGLITPIYARGGAHMLRAQSGFYGGIRSLQDQVAVYDCLDRRFPAFGNELKGLHVLAAQGGNFPGVLTRNRPVHSLADLKGLRLRAQSDAIDVLRALGADPVNMPMGEVYSALAKGVIDGVVAPADTIKSLHFAEVAHHFTSLRFSRGAYPARAMSDRAWQRLSPAQQRLLAESRRVWEAALAKEVLKAEAAGVAYASGHGVEMIPFPAGEQARLDTLYNRFALDQAQRLSAVGIDGVPVFREAQRLIAAGPIACAPSPSGVTP